MATKRVVTAEARGHVADARDWYEQDRPGRGRHFLLRATECFAAVGRTPRGGRPRADGYRQMKVPRFPYIAIFRHDPAAKTVTVVAVFHTSRDPGDLLRRLT